MQVLQLLLLILNKYVRAAWLSWLLLLRSVVQSRVGGILTQENAGEEAESIYMYKEISGEGLHVYSILICYHVLCMFAFPTCWNDQAGGGGCICKR